MSSRPIITSQKGFTLLEILVVTAILGILIGVSTSVFLGILRSQNKTTITNEVRQNANLAIDLFERDVRSAAEVTPSGVSTNQITLELASGDVGWVCEDTVVGNNGLIKRVVGGVDEVLTNTDLVSGVDVDCGGSVSANAFDVSGVPENRIVRFSFSIEQGVDAPARNDYNIDLPFETTVGTRVF